MTLNQLLTYLSRSAATQQLAVQLGAGLGVLAIRPVPSAASTVRARS